MVLGKRDKELCGGIFRNRLLHVMTICTEPSAAGAKREL